MPTEIHPRFAFDNSFERELEGLYEPWQATAAPAPRLLALNEQLGAELGLNPAELRSPEGVAILVGNVVAGSATPIAQAYAGHQFGGFSPRLGDGRALLIGELIDTNGRRRDLHLKGSGRTPFARGGDGKAAVGPMLREYIISEALHALGIPTTRSLAVVATGESIHREGMVPGAILTRVAASHLRVGSFQYAANSADQTLLPRLADYAIARHYPQARETNNPYLTLVELVMDAQASLVAKWMQVGFIHGVMNTDNVTISGESIDFGPCAFMDAYDPETVFSSIDHTGRYAFGNQPTITQWNLARFAETLLPLIDNDTDHSIEVATDLLKSFPQRFRANWLDGMRAKLGIGDVHDHDAELIDDFLAILKEQHLDYTLSFRALSDRLRGSEPTTETFTDSPAFAQWTQRWHARLPSQPRAVTADAMDKVNPLYIARNHIVEQALETATNGDLGAFEALVEAIRSPFTERAGMNTFTQQAPAEFAGYRTFCGT